MVAFIGKCCRRDPPIKMHPEPCGLFKAVPAYRGLVVHSSPTLICTLFQKDSISPSSRNTVLKSRRILQIRKWMHGRSDEDEFVSNAGVKHSMLPATQTKLDSIYKFVDQNLCPSRRRLQSCGRGSVSRCQSPVRFGETMSRTSENARLLRAERFTLIRPKCRVFLMFMFNARPLRSYMKLKRYKVVLVMLPT